MFRTTLLTSHFQNQEKDICTKSHICVEPCIDFKLFVLGVSGGVWTCDLCKVCMYIYTSCSKVCVCCFCVSLGFPFQLYNRGPMQNTSHAVVEHCRSLCIDKNDYTHMYMHIYRERCTDLP